MSHTHDPSLWIDARHNLPLPRLMVLLGDEQYTVPRAECPFCHAKGGKFGIFNKAGRDFFKCHIPSCDANEPAVNSSEIGYLALRRNLGIKEAAKEYLRLAFRDQPDRVPNLFPKSGEPVTPAQVRESVADPAEPDAMDVDSRNPWHALWKKLPLTHEDHETIKKKRGFSPEVIKLHGIRSNKPTNRPLVESLDEQFTVSQLVAEGIFKEEGRSRPGPAGQLCGYGITDKKDEDGKVIFELNEPPIIPYFGPDGIPFYLRPHKGGVAKPADEIEEIELRETEEEERQCSSHVFVPLGTEELVAHHDGLCIFTEGEFKAIAGTQCQMPIIACPGISFIRNPKFRDELIEVLDRLCVTDLVIIFDNEVKDDPAFPKRYKPDPNKQWDTQVYAQYSLRELRPHLTRNGGTVRVGQLPDEHRVDGKADFDGILAKCVSASGLERGTKEARKIFQKAVAGAAHVPTRDLFPSRAERIIESKVEAMFRQANVPAGGERELKLAKRFSAYDHDARAVIDKPMADALRSVIGCYYVRKAPDKDRRKELVKTRDRLNEDIDELKRNLELEKNESPVTKEMRARLNLMFARRAAVWEWIKGMPVPISTFKLECEYKLHDSSGYVQYLVRVERFRCGRNIKEKELRALSRDDTARLADFRKWCLGIGDAVFGGDEGGDKDLQKLTKDLNAQSYLREIYEINAYGWHRDTGIWFFGDCAFPPGGPIILADDSGIFWHGGSGYQVTHSAHVTGIEAFSQGAPLLLRSQDRTSKPNNPDWLRAVRDEIVAAGTKDHRELLTLAESMLNEAETPDALRLVDEAPTALQAKLRTKLTGAILKSFARDLHDTIGDYDGEIAVGLMIAYAIGPELCRHDGHPGNWLTGRMSSGKTTIGRWLMRPWGFKELGGVKLGEKSSTAVGINRGLTQYSSIPFLFDEYRRHTIDPEKEEVLRGAFDRSGGLKGVADGSNKTRNPIAKTTPIVMGESSSRDAATRSRYAQVNVSAHKRIGDGRTRYLRVQQDCKHYYLIGRWLMEHREEFSAAAMETLQTMMQSENMRSKIANDRVRHVYSTAFASFTTAAGLLGVLDAEAHKALLSFIHQHGERSLQDVIEETYLAQFFDELITMRRRGKVDARYFDLRYVRIDDNGALHPINANLPGAVRVCYIAFKAVFQAYEADARARGVDVKLSEGDIRRELEKEPYWIAPPKNDKNRQGHRPRLGDGHKASCWVFSMERVPAEAGREEETEENRPYICPFAEDLIDVLSPLKDPSNES